MVALEWRRRGSQAGTPATLANFIRIDEIVGSLAAFGAFNGNGSGNTANV
jgi:hypothetical protein